MSGPEQTGYGPPPRRSPPLARTNETKRFPVWGPLKRIHPPKLRYIYTDKATLKGDREFGGGGRFARLHKEINKESHQETNEEINEEMHKDIHT